MEKVRIKNKNSKHSSMMQKERHLWGYLKCVCPAIERIFNELSELLCEAVELRYFYDESIENIFNSLIFSNDSTFRVIEIIVKYNKENHTQKNIDFLFKNINRLLKITFHSAEVNEIIEMDYDKKFAIYTKSKIDSESHCGAVALDNFNSNMLFFSEAKKFNSCLNKKISIDKKGFVKNCPSSNETFGEIKSIKLQDVLKIKEFKTLWGVTKDQIEDCKVCEHRYICQDCRVYINNKDNIYSKPKKCNYNPYEAVWM